MASWSTTATRLRWPPAAAGGAQGTETVEEVVGALNRPRAVWVAVPSRAATNQTIDALSGFRSRGDTVVDGGNSHYRDAQRWSAQLQVEPRQRERPIMLTLPVRDHELERLGINVIRGLAVDTPQLADSGHSGTAMTLPPLAHVLWTRVLRHDPSAPDWPDRDRSLWTPTSCKPRVTSFAEAFGRLLACIRTKVGELRSDDGQRKVGP